MTKFARLFLPLLILGSGVAVAELKIAVISVQQAISQSEEAKAKVEAMGEELEKDQTELQALSDEIKALNERLAKDAEVMSDSEQRRAQKDIEDKQLELQFGVQKLQKAAQDGQQEILREMSPKLNAVLKDIIDLEGYDVVMDRQAFLYVNPKHDITRKITELLNDKE